MRSYSDRLACAEIRARHAQDMNHSLHLYLDKLEALLREIRETDDGWAEAIDAVLDPAGETDG